MHEMSYRTILAVSFPTYSRTFDSNVYLSALGLAIAQALVQAHHGSLNVQSELGIGNTFTTKLPYKTIFL